MLQDDCVDLFIQHFSFWEHLSDQEKELLCDNTIAAHYPKGISVHSGNEDCIGILVVKKGEKIPVDGVLISENSVFDTSMLTGESTPVILNRDDKVLSGFIFKYNESYKF